MQCRMFFTHVIYVSFHENLFPQPEVASHCQSLRIPNSVVPFFAKLNVIVTISEVISFNVTNRMSLYVMK